MRDGASATKLLLVAAVCGLTAALATGIFRNDPGIGLPEVRHYGYPLAWLVTDMNGPTRHLLEYLALDALFWSVVSLVALSLARKMLT